MSTLYPMNKLNSVEPVSFHIDRYILTNCFSLQVNLYQKQCKKRKNEKT